tara:strand:+ start:341 stop:862 length:522 start_codon:yes stop_codon:yes gene_type:complete
MVRRGWCRGGKRCEYRSTLRRLGWLDTRRRHRVELWLSGWHLDKSCQRTNELCTRLRNYLPIPNTGRDADASVAGAGEEDSCRKCGLNAVDPTSVVGPVLSKGAGPAGNPDLAWGEPHAEMQLEVVEDSGDDVFIAQMQHWLAVAAERYSQDLATRGWGPVSPFLGTERDGGD